MRIQALFAQPAIERLDKGVVDRTARSAEVERHLVLVGPAVESVRRELWAVVDANALGCTAASDDCLQDTGDLFAGDALVDLDRQRLAGEYVGQGQGAQAAPIEQSIRNEVHRPDLVRRHCLDALYPVRGADVASGSSEPQIQAFFAVETPNALVVHGDAFPTQSDV